MSEQIPDFPLELHWVYQGCLKMQIGDERKFELSSTPSEEGLSRLSAALGRKLWDKAFSFVADETVLTARCSGI